MTFNIQSGSRGLKGVAEAIQEAGPDLVALQEVDNKTKRSKGMDQVQQLSEMTGLYYHAHFRACDLQGGPYGVALLSKFPLVDMEHFTLPSEKGLEPRTVARAKVAVEGRDLSVYVTHLTNLPTRGALRMRQVRRIMSLVAQDPRPVVLLGDFNENGVADGVQLIQQQLTDAFAVAGQGPSGTYPLPAFLPELRFDFVFTSPAIKALKTYVLRRPASDHYPVVADLGFASSAPVAAAQPANPADTVVGPAATETTVRAGDAAAALAGATPP
ncbi:MAG: endonuclease/exonuclease/phosphatase family protein [Myxococcaceae bacterium]